MRLTAFSCDSSLRSQHEQGSGEHASLTAGFLFLGLQKEIEAFLHLSPDRLWDRQCEEKGTDRGLKTKGKLRFKTQKVVRFFNFAFQHCSLTYIYSECEVFFLWLFFGFFFFNL